jgi:ergothioneine biosynthesis protein EgtB
MPDHPAFTPSPAALAARYLNVRAVTELLCEPLEPEDYQLQSMPDCSPPKWHLAHTAWFFETFVLAPHLAGYQPFHPQFGYLFNSYYDAVGDRWPRPARGLLSRPTVGEVTAYRHAVDEQLLALLNAADEPTFAAVAPLVELGLNHEEQHQELLLTDLKTAFGMNPLRPVYAPPSGPLAPRAGSDDRSRSEQSTSWHPHPAGVRWVGHAGGGFAFDNEGPRHRVFVDGFEIATRVVTNGEYRRFIEDGGYDRPELWLSDGWAAKAKGGWVGPRYWHREGWQVFTLHGMQPLDPHGPVCHVSYYEADAYARWAGVRLPTEFEWEAAVADRPVQGQFLGEVFHPTRADGEFGGVWVWTASPYTAYPGYRPPAGALGEYNGKFMCNQMVLRGGSCVTPTGHVRATYRNFFPPDARWQFSGIRLARDAQS